MDMTDSRLSDGQGHRPSRDFGGTGSGMGACRLSFSETYDRMGDGGAAGPVPSTAKRAGKVANIANRRTK